MKTACPLLSEGAPKVDGTQLHRLDKADTKSGPESLRNLARMGVPYAMLLYEMLIATQGKVFTADTLPQMVVHTRLKDFASKLP